MKKPLAMFFANPVSAEKNKARFPDAVYSIEANTDPEDDNSICVIKDPNGEVVKKCRDNPLTFFRDANGKPVVDAFFMISAPGAYALRSAEKCMCAECSHVQDLPDDYVIMGDRKSMRIRNDVYELYDNDDEKISCEKCGHKFSTISTVKKNTSYQTADGRTPDYIMPTLATSYCVWEESDDATGAVKSVTADIMTTTPVVFARDNSIFFDETKVSQKVDVESRKVQNIYAKKIKNSDGRSAWNAVSINEAYDPYSVSHHSTINGHVEQRRFVEGKEGYFRVPTFDMLSAYHSVSIVGTSGGPSRTDAEALDINMNDDGNNASKFNNNALYRLKQDIVINELERNFADADRDDIMNDSAKSKLFYKMNNLFHVSDDDVLKDSHTGCRDAFTYLLTKYPAVYELSLRQADLDVTNESFRKKRKYLDKCAGEGKTPTEEEIADSMKVSSAGKAKMMRERVVSNMRQLSCSSDKIKNVVAKAKDADELCALLKNIAFGDKAGNFKDKTGISNADAKLSFEVIDSNKGLKTVNRTLDSVTPGSTFNTFFANHPIAVANTIYTTKVLCGKVNDNEMRDIVEWCDKNTVTHTCPTENRPEVISLYHTWKAKPLDKIKYMCGDVIDPASPDIEMLKSYEDNTRLCREVLDLYKGLRRDFRLVNPDLKENGGPKRTVDDSVAIEYKKISDMQNYLFCKPIEDAYISFSGKYSPDDVNSLVYKGELLGKKADILSAYDEGGVDAATKVYPELFEGVGDKEEQEKFVDFLVNLRKLGDKPPVATRNGKALGENISLKDLHDEMAHMTNNAITENIPFTYNDKAKALEAVYPDPDHPDDDKLTYKISLHKSSFDLKTSGNELRNCLGQGHVDNKLRKGWEYLYMTNPYGRRIAAIELQPVSHSDEYNYRVLQIQGKNDSYLNDAFAAVAMKWLDEHKIDYSSCEDVNGFNTHRFAYGGGNADYRNGTYYDVVTDKMYSGHELDNMEKERVKRAKNIFKYSPETGYDFSARSKLGSDFKIPEIIIGGEQVFVFGDKCVNERELVPYQKDYRVNREAVHNGSDGNSDGMSAAVETVTVEVPGT